MDERLKTIENQRQNALNESNNVYNNILRDNETLYNQQQEYVKQYQTTQDDILNKQLENNLQKIEQQKKDTRNNFDTESIRARNSYEAYVNPYGYNANRLVDNGLSNSGTVKMSNDAAFTAYNSRVATANKAMQDAITQYDLAISDARLNNDVQKAQNALAALQMNLDFTTNFYSNKANYSINQLNSNQNLDNTYYSRYQDIINQINYEKEQEEARRQYEQQFAYQKQRDKVADSQWQKQYELSKKKLTSDPIGTLEDNNTTTNNDKITYTSTGVKMSQIFDGAGSLANNNIVKGSDGKYYVYDSRANDYVDVDEQARNIIDRGYKVNYWWGK